MVHLKDDTLIAEEEGLLVTKWKVLKPRKDFTHGYSCYFLTEGWKCSQYLRADGTLLYHYIDLIQTEHNAETNTYIIHDLLIDVIIMPNGEIRVLDVGEVPEAVRQGLISADTAMHALTLLDNLLELLYGGRFDTLLSQVRPYIPPEGFLCT